MSLTLEQLLQKPVRKVAGGDVPEGHFSVRSLTAMELMQMDDAIDAQTARDAPDSEKLRGVLAVKIATYLCDDEGNPIATVEQAIEMVNLRSKEFVRDVIKVAEDLNGISKAAQEATAKN